MFCVGDIVVYGAQGLCKVDGIGPLPMKFADKSKRYYTLHTCKQPSMTIYAPVDNQTVVMRQPLNRAQAETLISEMPQYAVVPIMDAKERESRCREALQTCDCREIAKMIKGLHDRHEIRVQHKKHDTAADRGRCRSRLYCPAHRPCLTSGNHIGQETSTLIIFSLPIAFFCVTI